MKLTELFLNRWLYRDSQQNLETKDAVFDASNVIPANVPALASGGAAQDINTSNVTINGGQLTPGTFPVTTLNISNWGWTQTCVFTVVSAVKVSWGAGTFTSADGSTVAAISAGDTGNMGAAPAKTYVYYDVNFPNVYKISTSITAPVGVGKVLIAVCSSDTTTATYNLVQATQIVGDNILANSINASKITTGQLIVGTNVGIGSAFPTTSAGDLAYLDLVGEALLDSTVIVGGLIKTSLLSANNIITGTLNASLVTVSNINATNINTGSLSGISIAIGTGNNIFKADASGICLGNATFLSAPFRVNMQGEVTATKITISTTDSSYTGTPIAAAYIGNLSAAKITSGTITIGGTSQPSLLELIASSGGGGGTTVAKMTWNDTAGGTLRGKIWADTSGYMGYNAIGGRHYFYTADVENVVIQDSAQTVFNEGISCRGAFNVGIPNSTTEKARFTDGAYFDATTATAQEIWGGSNQMIYNSYAYHYFNINTIEKLKCSSTGVSVSNGFFYLPILTGTEAAGYTAQEGSMYYRSDDDAIRVNINGTIRTLNWT